MINSGVDINALRREKETALINLGKAMHKMIRDGEITNAAYSGLSERIAQIDSQICIYGGARVPAQGEGVCPICRNQIAPTAAFCGGCGTNITDYYSQYTKQCNKCGQITASDGQYCTVCGSRH